MTSQIALKNKLYHDQLNPRLNLFPPPIQDLAPPPKDTRHIERLTFEFYLPDLFGVSADGQFPLEKTADFHPADIREKPTVYWTVAAPGRREIQAKPFLSLQKSRQADHQHDREGLPNPCV